VQQELGHFDVFSLGTCFYCNSENHRGGFFFFVSRGPVSRHGFQKATCGIQPVPSFIYPPRLLPRFTLGRLASTKNLSSCMILGPFFPVYPRSFLPLPFRRFRWSHRIRPITVLPAEVERLLSTCSRFLPMAFFFSLGPTSAVLVKTIIFPSSPPLVGTGAVAFEDFPPD